MGLGVRSLGRGREEGRERGREKKRERKRGREGGREGEREGERETGEAKVGWLALPMHQRVRLVARLFPQAKSLQFIPINLCVCFAVSIDVVFHVGLKNL